MDKVNGNRKRSTKREKKKGRATDGIITGVKLGIKEKDA
jgi:hypothetical protein